MIKLAIEKVWRYFKQDKDRFVCLSIQIPFKKNELISGKYKYKISSKDKELEKTILIDIENNKIQTIGSHEDPLISNDKEYLISLHVDLIEPILKEDVSVFIIKDDEIIKQYDNVSFLDVLELNINDNSMLNEYTAKSNIDGILRIHKGYQSGIYNEEEYEIKAGFEINIEKYLHECEYLGIQFSYVVNGIDIEEKYIPIGQKNMSISGNYYDGSEIFQSLFPNIKKYQKLYYLDDVLNDDEYFSQIKEDWVDINNINDLLFYGKKNKPVFFETDINLIKNQYLDNYTYGINKTISRKKFINIKHINSEICKNCDLNYKCLQFVPSGLSYDLYKEVVSISKKEACKIYNFIGKH